MQEPPFDLVTEMMTGEERPLTKDDLEELLEKANDDANCYHE